MGGSPQGVDSQIWFAGMALLSKNFQPQPQHAFFAIPMRVPSALPASGTMMRSRGEKSSPWWASNRPDPLAAGLLVGHERQPDRPLRCDTRFKRARTAKNEATIPWWSSSTPRPYNKSPSTCRLKGSACHRSSSPTGTTSKWLKTHTFSGWWPGSRATRLGRCPRHPIIRGRIVRNRKLQLLELDHQKVGSFGFARGMVVRAHGHPADQFPLHGDHVIPIAGDEVLHAEKR